MREIKTKKYEEKKNRGERLADGGGKDDMRKQRGKN